MLISGTQVCTLRSSHMHLALSRGSAHLGPVSKAIEGQVVRGPARIPVLHIAPVLMERRAAARLGGRRRRRAAMLRRPRGVQGVCRACRVASGAQQERDWGYKMMPQRPAPGGHAALLRRPCTGARNERSSHPPLYGRVWKDRWRSIHALCRALCTIKNPACVLVPM